MSFLRYSSPGQPTVLVDMGPSNGRMHGSRYGTRGSTVSGALVVGISDRDKANSYQRAYTARMREMFPATTPARREQIAAYKARRR